MTKLSYFISFVVLILISLTIYNKPAEAFDPGKCHTHPGQVCEYYAEWEIGDENYGNCDHEPPKELEED